MQIDEDIIYGEYSSSGVIAKLANLREQMEHIGGMWNGDEAGSQEDRAHIANEIIEHIDALQTLLEELYS